MQADQHVIAGLVAVAARIGAVAASLHLAVGDGDQTGKGDQELNVHSEYKDTLKRLNFKCTFYIHVKGKVEFQMIKFVRKEFELRLRESRSRLFLVAPLLFFFLFPVSVCNVKR